MSAKISSPVPEIKPALRRGLYVHIPFCLKKCHYCDFVITTKQDSASRGQFLAALEKEIGHAASKYGRLHFDTLYLGGGTPSALEPEEFNRAAALLRQKFDFSPDSEITVEVNPGDVNAEKISAYRECGVNRISLGVQAFQDKLLKNMNRAHGSAEISATVESLRSAGLNNISMDMILNLPDQSEDDVDETLHKIIALKPNQVSVYDLDVHEDTVYGLRRREGRLNLAHEEVHARMAANVAKTLKNAGFIHYELSNFAKPGFESRHNLIYWDNQPYLGLGPGAFSYLDGVRYQFAGSVDRYFAKLTAGDFTNDTEDRLTPYEKEKETLLTGLRLRTGFDLRRLDLLRAKAEAKADAYIQEGLVEKDGFRLKFTDQGKPVAETILRAFASI